MFCNAKSNQSIKGIISFNLIKIRLHFFWSALLEMQPNGRILAVSYPINTPDATDLVNIATRSEVDEHCRLDICASNIQLKFLTMQYLNIQSVFLSIIICGIAIVFLLSSVLPAEAVMDQTNPVISIQGTLKNSQGEVVQDDTYSVTFKLYHQATGGDPVWEEEASVEVTGGVYSHMLGTEEELDPDDFSEQVWLGVVIDGFELSPRTIFSYSPYSFSVENAQHALTADEVFCSGAVGDVKHSILDPDQFVAVNGECWVPMDGRQMDPDDELRQITGLTHVPQGGGMFLRAQDFENSDNDPDRDHTTDIASVQDDEFGDHNHGMSSAGSHRHGTGVIIELGVDGGHRVSYAYWSRRPHGGTQPSRRASGHSSVSDPDSTRQGETSWDGAHTHNIHSTGGDETRPKNLNFWIYIRIN